MKTNFFVIQVDIMVQDNVLATDKIANRKWTSFTGDIIKNRHDGTSFATPHKLESFVFCVLRLPSASCHVSKVALSVLALRKVSKAAKSCVNRA
jgi:hypothetical protein